MLSPNPGTKLTASTPAQRQRIAIRRAEVVDREIMQPSPRRFYCDAESVWHSQDRNEERVESLRSECAWLTMVCRSLQCGLSFEPKNGHGRKRQNSTLRSTPETRTEKPRR